MGTGGEGFGGEGGLIMNERYLTSVGPSLPHGWFPGRGRAAGCRCRRRPPRPRAGHYCLDQSGERRCGKEGRLMRKSGLCDQGFDLGLVDLRGIGETNASDLLALAFEQSVRIAQRGAMEEEERDPPRSGRLFQRERACIGRCFKARECDECTCVSLPTSHEAAPLSSDLRGQAC